MRGSDGEAGQEMCAGSWNVRQIIRQISLWFWLVCLGYVSPSP